MTQVHKYRRHCQMIPDEYLQMSLTSCPGLSNKVLCHNSAQQDDLVQDWPDGRVGSGALSLLQASEDT